MSVTAPDDGALDVLTDRIRLLLGGAISPAHPRTRTVDKIRRDDRHAAHDWYFGSTASSLTARALRGTLFERLICERLINVKLDALGGKTPREAADSKDPEQIRALRAVILRLEGRPECPAAGLGRFREILGVGQEPEIDPETIVSVEDVAAVPIWRLRDLDPSKLRQVEVLGAYIDQAALYNIPAALERAIEPLYSRRDELSDEDFDWKVTEIGQTLRLKGEFERVHGLIARGRALLSRSGAEQPLRSLDLFEMEVLLSSEPAEKWAPALFRLHERCIAGKKDVLRLYTFLQTMGLVSLSRNPDDENSILVDRSVLDQVFARYGPRIQTVAGSSEAGKIWTPGEAAGGSPGSRIWTPEGNAQADQGEAPKLIVPGR